MVTPILQTKLHIPVPGEEFVHRPSLLNQLDRGLSKRLTLVCGPAGSGKSTLLSQWIRSDKPFRGVAEATWLSLDSSDSDLNRFFTYFVTALRRIADDLGNSALSMMTGPGPIHSDSVMTLLINDISENGDEIVLVLDDYHLIEDRGVDEALDFLLNNMPANFHLVMLSRINPSISLSRLRARNQLVELRASDLRFSVDETKEYLSRSISIDLSEIDIAGLSEKTEGWIAGLQLLGISIKRSDDPAAFIRSYAEADAFILDYLGDEVLSLQPEKVQDFLVRTSILDRLSVGLCRQVSNRSDAGEMIETLVRENLFIIPLDEHRRWYRYHHLFADLLRQRLERRDRDLIPELHHRASLWYLEEDLIEPAFHHAQLSDKPGLAVSILEQSWYIFTHRGEFKALKRMLESLGPDITGRSAPLSMAWCWCSQHAAAFDSLTRHLDDARRALQSQELTRHDDSSLMIRTIPSQIEAMEAVLQVEKKDPLSAKACALRSIDLIPLDAPPPVRGLLFASAGFWLAQAYRDLGETDEACALYLKLVDLMKVSENQVGAANAIWQFAKLNETAGKIAETTSLCREALQFIDAKGWSELPPTGLVHMAFAIGLHLSGDPRLAQEHLDIGRRLLEPTMSPHYREMVIEAESRILSGKVPMQNLAEPLTERELEVLSLIAQGLSNQDIGERLYLALSTVKGHNQNIFDKLNVKRRTEAVACARELGLI